MRKSETTAGFTVVELAVVLILVGVLSGTTMVRFFSSTKFKEDFYLEETAAALRYAQMLAVGSGCDVQVDFNPALNQDIVLKQKAGCTGGALVDIVHPGTTAAQYVVDLPARITVTSDMDPILFDGSGSIVDGNSGLTTVSVKINVDALPTRTLTASSEIGIFN